MQKILQDKSVLVLGGSGKLGGTICKTLAAAGAIVGVHYFQNYIQAMEVVKDIEKLGGQAYALGADLRKENDLSCLVEQAVKECGRLDGAVNTVHGAFPQISIRDMVWDDWQLHIEALRIHFELCKAVLPQMRTQKYGRIVFLSGGLAYRYYSGCAAFSTIKAGLNAFCKCLAREEGENNITVNIVAPGRVETADHIMLLKDDELNKCTLKRFASPEEVADTVLYFLSPLSDGVSGHTIYVSGGEIMPV